MKRKVFQKLMAASLATAMAVGMAGCGNTPSEPANGSDNQSQPSDESTTPADNSEESTEESSDVSADSEVGKYTALTDENGNVYDLGGMEIIIRDWYSGDGSVPEAKSDFEEAQQEYREWLQETYNFTLKEMTISDWGSAPADFNDYVTTGGDDNNYIFRVRDDAATSSAMGQGLMYDLSSLDCLDLTDSKYTKNKLIEKYSNSKGIFAMHPGDPEPRTGVYFNKSILRDAGIDPEELYDLQASGDWTWDKLREYMEKVQQDVDNDGAIDIYGFNDNNGLFNYAIFSNGGAYIGKDADGKYTYELENANTMEAMEWASDMITKYRQVPPQDAQWDYYKQAFLNGEIAFLIEDAYAMYYKTEEDHGYLTDMEDDFGFVMFPKGPQMDDYINVWADNVTCIPACYDADRAWKLAFAFDLWTDDVPGYEGYQNWAHVYAGARDTRSVDETYKMMLTKGMITYEGVLPQLQIGPDFLWGAGAKGAVISEKVEAIRDTWKGYVEAANQ